jgi:alanine-glyoxylate transaminase/serine-glyoxylate transaminase/serine-pyruvate transaminase
MIPGPVPVEESVLEAMSSPVQAHYGPRWVRIYNETRELLKQVFRTEGTVHLLVGTGTAALDAAIGSMTCPGEKIVVGVNGFFGMRLGQIGHGYGLDVVTVEAPQGKPLDPEEIGAALDRHPDACALAVVHLETSTTVVNPLPEIAAQAKERGVPVIVDAVSSLGGLPMEMDVWGVSICVSASQKCLGAPPGLAPIAISPQAWKVIHSKPNRAHGWYLNLETWEQYEVEWGEWHPYPVTMAVNNVLALRAGLQSLLREGIEARLQRYARLALRLRAGVRRLGMEPYTPDAWMAPVITGILCPPGVSAQAMRRYLLEEYNIRVAGGLVEELKDRLLRVGHMSPTINAGDIEALLEGMAVYLKQVSKA